MTSSRSTAVRIAQAARRGDPEGERIARRDHAAERLAAFVAKTVAAAPPLTDAQAERIAGLLRGPAASLTASSDSPTTRAASR